MGAKYTLNAGVLYIQLCNGEGWAVEYQKIPIGWNGQIN